MVISLDQIQPTEFYLCEEAVQFFQKSPKKLFNYEEQIVIYYVQRGKLFKYFIKDGHHRLLACHRLKITEIPVEPREDFTRPEQQRAVCVYKKGIRHIADLEKHLLPAMICSALSF